MISSPANKESLELLLNFIKSHDSDKIHHFFENNKEVIDWPKVLNILFKDSDINWIQTALRILKQFNLKALADDLVLIGLLEKTDFQLLADKSIKKIFKSHTASNDHKRIAINFYIIMEADVNATFSSTKETLLHYVTETQVLDKSLIEQLLKNGANPNVKDLIGNTPLDCVLKRYNNNENAYEIIELLIQYKADIKLLDEQPVKEYRRIPLLATAGYLGCPKLFKLFMDNGATLNQWKDKDKLAYQAVIEQKDDKLLSYLEQVGAKVPMYTQAKHHYDMGGLKSRMIIVFNSWLRGFKMDFETEHESNVIVFSPVDKKLSFEKKTELQEKLSKNLMKMVDLCQANQIKCTVGTDPITLQLKLIINTPFQEFVEKICNIRENQYALFNRAKHKLINILNLATDFDISLESCQKEDTTWYVISFSLYVVNKDNTDALNKMLNYIINLCKQDNIPCHMSKSDKPELITLNLDELVKCVVKEAELELSRHKPKLKEVFKFVFGPSCDVSLESRQIDGSVWYVISLISKELRENGLIPYVNERLQAVVNFCKNKGVKCQVLPSANSDIAEIAALNLYNFTVNLSKIMLPGTRKSTFAM